MRFIYLCDTHHGKREDAYCQQKPYAAKNEELFYLLAQFIKSQPAKIDFVLNGGDLLNKTNLTCIKEIQTFHQSLGVPVYLCLGNHDLSQKNALDVWLKSAPELFLDDKPEFTITDDKCALHVIPNHWDEVEYFCDGTQIPYFCQAQIKFLDKAIEANKNKTQVLAIHAPVLGIPIEQTGLSEIIHTSWGDFGKKIIALVKTKKIRLVLSAHSHINSCQVKNDCTWVSGSAFSEVPFDFKVIEVTNKGIQIKTENLIDQVRFKTKYNFNATYVQGRDCDRNQEVHF
jgi:3',5'-cyclic AMP phosphodiesterase CpdA